MVHVTFTGAVTSLVSDRPLPQSGFAGSTSQPAAVGSDGDYGYSVQVIGRWTEAPYQTFSGTKTFTCLGLHKADYTRRLKVRFAVDGGGWFQRSAVAITPGDPTGHP